MENDQPYGVGEAGEGEDGEDDEGWVDPGGDEVVIGVAFVVEWEPLGVLVEVRTAVGAVVGLTVGVACFFRVQACSGQ